MNYNGKKNENIEIDDMKIKSHLNASLDLSGISVSEDLINRTLEAIKKSSEEQLENEVSKTSSEDYKKVIPWNRYIRTFAGVAAAAVVVVAGYGLFSGALFSAKKSDTQNSTNIDMAYDASFTESTTAASDSDTYQAKMEGEAMEEATASDEMANAAGAFTAEESMDTADAVVEAPLFSITADIVEEDAGEGISGFTGESIASSTPSDSRLGEYGVDVLTFRDIFLADPAQAEYITVTDEVNKTSITLTSQVEINDFYGIMDQQQFTFASGSSSDTNYSIEVTATPEAALYTMTIGTQVTVVYTGAEVASQSLYDAVDIEALKIILGEFYQKYAE